MYSEPDEELPTVNVQVAVRCRPISEMERNRGSTQIATVDRESGQIQVSYGPSSKKLTRSYAYNDVFGPYSSQSQLFRAMAVPVIDEVMQGYNCTIFAYGQTGTGKTYTMEGDMSNQELAGIIPRSVRLIFDRLEGSGADYNVNVSFLELYNEELADLLAPPDELKRLRLVEDVRKGVVCQNLEEIAVLTADDIFQILERGIEQRRVAETLLNKTSSRSHCIFTLKIMIKESTVDGDDYLRHGQLNLVDLAGSECIGRSGSKNARAREAGTINQSLLTLGRVITALVDGHSHVPYRDSKLTRLLQESLGGRAKTCIIATISPSSDCADETLSTLDYAYRAKDIRNRPEINQRVTTRGVMKEYAVEVEALKHALQITRDKNGVYVDPAEYEQMTNRLQTQEQQIRDLEQAFHERQEELRLVREAKAEVEETLRRTQGKLQRTEQQLSKTENALATTRTHLHHTRVEFMANRALVKAQSETEEALSAQAKAWGEEVVARRADVDRLFQRADAHEQFEEGKRGEARVFGQDLQRIAQSICSEIETTQTECKANHDAFEEHVSSMVSEGKSTCAGLQRSIDDALTSLTTDTDHVTSQMTTSLSGLHSHLGDANNRATTALEHVRDSLTAFFSSLEEQLNDVEQHVATQTAALDKMGSRMKSYHKSMDKSVNAFVRDHQATLESTRTRAEQLQATLDETRQAHAIEREKLIHAERNALRHKTDEIQAAVARMLNELATQGEQSLNTVHSKEQEADGEAEQTLQEGVAELKEMVHTGATQTAEWSESAKQKGQEHLRSIRKDINAVQQEATAVQGVAEGVMERLNEQRQETPETIAQVSKDIAQAIESGQATVTDTADVARTMPTHVRTAASKMEQAASDAVTSFNDVLERSGQTLSANLSKHFSQLLEFFAGGEEHMSDIVARTTDHMNKACEDIQHEVTAPERADEWEDLQPLPQTEGHNTLLERQRTDMQPHSETFIVEDITRNMEEAQLSALDLSMVGGTTPVHPDFTVEMYRREGAPELGDKPPANAALAGELNLDTGKESETSGTSTDDEESASIGSGSTGSSSGPAAAAAAAAAFHAATAGSPRGRLNRSASMMVTPTHRRELHRRRSDDGIADVRVGQGRTRQGLYPRGSTSSRRGSVTKANSPRGGRSGSRGSISAASAASVRSASPLREQPPTTPPPAETTAATTNNAGGGAPSDSAPTPPTPPSANIETSTTTSTTSTTGGTETARATTPVSSAKERGNASINETPPTAHPRSTPTSGGSTASRRATSTRRSTVAGSRGTPGSTPRRKTGSGSRGLSRSSSTTGAETNGRRSASPTKRRTGSATPSPRGAAAASAASGSGGGSGVHRTAGNSAAPLGRGTYRRSDTGRSAASGASGASNETNGMAHDGSVDFVTEDEATATEQSVGAASRSTNGARATQPQQERNGTARGKVASSRNTSANTNGDDGATSGTSRNSPSKRSIHRSLSSHHAELWDEHVEGGDDDT